MSISPITNSSDTTAVRLVPGPDGAVTTAAPQNPAVDVQKLSAPLSDDWKTEDLNYGQEHIVRVTDDHPTGIDAIEVKTFRLGDDGPSMQIASLGATPLQVTTADGKKIFWNSLDDGSGNLKNEIKWNLGGAGFLGGAPIVGPASRIADKEGKPIINYGKRTINLGEDGLKLVGANNRIPKDPTGLAMHGAIFTSPEWRCTEIKTKGNEAIRVTYELNFADDYALTPFGKDAKATVVYTLKKDEKQNPVFETVLQFTNPKDSTEDLLLGSVAQHCFFGLDKENPRETILEAENLTLQYEGSPNNPAMPTGKILDIHPTSPYLLNSTSDVDQPIAIYQRLDNGQPLDAVLTDDLNRKPLATIHRSDGVSVQLETDGEFDGLVVCTKNPNGLMVEPIARRPNNFNTPSPYPEIKKDKPIVIEPDQAIRFVSKISLV